MKKIKPTLKKSLYLLILIFIGMNSIAFFQAYKFTHFDSNSVQKTKKPKELTTIEKTKTLLFGINNPKPTNKTFPTQNYETIKLGSDFEIECWSIKTNNSKGTVILFHGYGGEKSTLLGQSNIFLNLGYNTLLVDFMGSGGSQGYQTTIGFHESEQVKLSYEYLKRNGEKNIYLFGTSMGSVAILKAIDVYKINPEGIIIECPFGTMYQTVCSRFETMNAPTFPMAGLLVFWGGIQNGFWAFGHNPSEYADSTICPTLLMYGEHDEKVSRQEIDEIFKNLKGKKQLKLYPKTGHENYLIKNKEQWTKDVGSFLE
ncbi:alpha/beta hydrolase [Cellulophaga sp. L1A9]|uniref:alpha/beta hydrolase n=1 Tax=Cellulophaga sp. L1A9 TaxID=2686362 RepID=UPI001E5F8A7D|nr:alpha/beta hydrolase [Cellulophaga sp. L1A9]